MITIITTKRKLSQNVRNQSTCSFRRELTASSLWQLDRKRVKPMFGCRQGDLRTWGLG